MSWFAYIVVGIIAGFLAKMVIKGEGPGGILGDMIIGIAGAIIGGWLFNMFGHVGGTGINVASIIVAFIGAVVLLLILRLIGKMRGAS
jgi:uncharacterized membrane protein YeaQ/YmgE (transglycosylase-associated protein family)